MDQTAGDETVNLTAERETPDVALHFTHFVLRLQYRAEAGSELTGVVERIGSGEKRSFSSAAELVKFLADAATAPPL